MQQAVPSLAEMLSDMVQGWGSVSYDGYAYLLLFGIYADRPQATSNGLTHPTDPTTLSPGNSTAPRLIRSERAL